MSKEVEHLQQKLTQIQKEFGELTDEEILEGINAIFERVRARKEMKKLRTIRKVATRPK